MYSVMHNIIQQLKHDMQRDECVVKYAFRVDSTRSKLLLFIQLSFMELAIGTEEIHSALEIFLFFHFPFA